MFDDCAGVDYAHTSYLAAVDCGACHYGAAVAYACPGRNPCRWRYERPLTVDLHPVGYPAAESQRAAGGEAHADMYVGILRSDIEERILVGAEILHSDPFRWFRRGVSGDRFPVFEHRHDRLGVAATADQNNGFHRL